MSSDHQRRTMNSTYNHGANGMGMNGQSSYQPHPSYPSQSMPNSYSTAAASSSFAHSTMTGSHHSHPVGGSNNPFAAVAPSHTHQASYRLPTGPAQFMQQQQQQQPQFADHNLAPSATSSALPYGQSHAVHTTNEHASFPQQRSYATPAVHPATNQYGGSLHSSNQSNSSSPPSSATHKSISNTTPLLDDSSVPSSTPTRSMPSFGERMRQRAGWSHKENDSIGSDEGQETDATGTKNRTGMANSGGVVKRTMLKVKQRALQFTRYIKSRPPIELAKMIGACLLVLFLLRFAFHSYEDRSKHAHFTIVSLLRDMSPDALTSDKMSYAFQYTALASWSRLVVGSNIIVFVDSQAQCAPIQSLVRGIQCLPIPCWHSEYNKPLMNCVFDHAHTYARTDIIAYVNGDVALYPDLVEAIDDVSGQKDKFVLIGRRTNTLISPVMLDDFQSPSFPDRLRIHAKRTGQLHSAYGIDLIVYRKKALEELKIMHSGEESPAGKALPLTPLAGLRFPPLLAGVYRWDNWLISQLILDESVAVVDITSQVMFIHQEKGREKHVDKIGGSYNDELVKQLSGTHYKIGTIDNAGYVLDEQHQVVPNQNVTDVVLFTKKASKDGYLVILTVNHNYINLALNWVCWADRIKFTNYILIAEDQSSATYFKNRGVAVIVDRNAPWIKKAGDYGSVEFQETMTFRTEFLMTVLNAGFHFVTADMDGLWLDDPLPYFNNAADLQGQMHKVTKISGGLVIVRATTYGRYFWNMVIECQRGNAQFLAKAKPGTYVAATYTEQYCINELSRGLAGQPLFSRSLLDPYIFPDGKSFFDERNSQYRGVWPAIIHNNWIVGTSNKIGRLHDWNLASAIEEKAMCAPLDRLPFPKLDFVPAPPQPEPLKEGEFEQLGAPPKVIIDTPMIPFAQHESMPFELKIRIFASTNVHALKRCLDSLAATDFEGDRSRITLEISIDHPPPNPEDSQVKGWNAVHLLANQFEWNPQARRGGPGEKVVIEQPYQIGLGGQYLRGWNPSSKNDQELMIFIDGDTQVLSPHWYQFMKRAIIKYYTIPDQYDARLMGISLGLQGSILGETYIHRYAAEDSGSNHNPYDELNNKYPYYKYQLFSASSAHSVTLLFPQHWRLFISWLERNNVDTITGAVRVGSSISTATATTSTPCVPTMISNKWWKESSVQHWYQWLNRFVFEEGYFFMYTNFEGRQAFALPNSVLNPIQTERRVIRILQPKLITNVTAIPALPSSSLIPVYDFHFNHVSTPDVLAWRKHIVSPKVIDQCWTMDQLAGKIAADEAALEAERKAKEEAKAKAAAEKKAAAKAEKDRQKAEKDKAAAAKKEAEAKAKAEKDAAAKAKKEADAKAKAKSNKKDDKKKSSSKKETKKSTKKDAKKTAKKDEKKSGKKKKKEEEEEEDEE